MIKEVFDKFKEKSSGTIKRDVLQQAYLEVVKLVKHSNDVPVLQKTAEQLMLEMDLDEDEEIDYDGFKRAVTQPLTQLEQWASMLPLAGMLASSLPISSGQGDQPLRDFSRLSENEINAAVEAFTRGLVRVLLEAKAELAQMFELADQKACEAAKDSGCSPLLKFKTFKMKTGKIPEYHMGLSSRIGKCPPSKWLFTFTFLS